MPVFFASSLAKILTKAMLKVQRNTSNLRIERSSFSRFFEQQEVDLPLETRDALR
jgi:hypothetical protein